MWGMAEPDTEIKVGDRVRALGGAFKGEVGTALRVVTSRDEGRTSCSILVSFPAGADYLGADELEKADAAQSG
jgi:transcription antitermination factor NusG